MFCVNVVWDLNINSKKCSLFAAKFTKSSLSHLPKVEFWLGLLEVVNHIINIEPTVGFFLSTSA